MPTDNELIWEAIDNYFEHATDDRQTNIRLAQSAIKRWKGGFIIGLCSAVAERIEREGAESVRSAMLGMSGLMLDLRLFAITKTVFKQWADIVSTLGKDTGTTLVADIGVCSDEDERALNALMLASNFIETIDNPMHLEMSRSVIEGFYRDTVGTSCKMALAWALYKLGTKKPWEELLYGGYFMKPEFMQLLEQALKAANPELRGPEIRETLCNWYALPENNELLEHLTPIPQRWGILEFLALDIASNGRQFKNYPKWQRKGK